MNFTKMLVVRVAGIVKTVVPLVMGHGGDYVSNFLAKREGSFSIEAA